jgi:hypothetical protein
LKVAQSPPENEQSSNVVARRGILLKPLGPLAMKNMRAIGQRESRTEGR